MDYAGHNPDYKLFLGITDPEKWRKYLKENYHNCKFKIIEGRIIINYEG